MRMPIWIEKIVDAATALVRPRVSVGGGKSAGMWVDNYTSLMHPGVWSCVRLISGTIATLGWHIIKLDVDGTKERVNGTPIAAAVDRVLNMQANPEMTAFSWRETALAHALLTGNHYSEIERDRMGRVLALWPIAPERVYPFRDEVTGELFYKVALEYGSMAILESRNVLHIKGLGWDGLTGVSVVGMARRSIGAGLAMDEYAANFYQNGTHMGIVLQHPKTLSETARQNLKKDLIEKYSGPGNAFRPLITEEGMTLNKLTMSMADAQFIESRKFQLGDIARWFGVPLHKIAELDRSTNNNIEHQSIEFVQDALLPWCRRCEQEVDVKLFGRAARGSMFTRLNIDTLLRGDMKSRNMAYKIGRDGGWLSANDIRRMENLDPIAGGDEYLVPLNNTTAASLGSPGAQPAEDDDEEPIETVEDKVRSLKAARERRRRNA